MATTVDNIAYGTYTALTVTNLQSLANDATDPFACWQSEIVDNRTLLADDFLVHFKLPTAATGPANDTQAYAYAVPWIHTGSAWVPAANFGTTTLPTGSEGTASISDPNSMRPFAPMPYKITSQQLDGSGNIATLFGGVMWQGFSLVVRNCTGAAFSTGCVVEVMAITYTNS